MDSFTFNQFREFLTHVAVYFLNGVCMDNDTSDVLNFILLLCLYIENAMQEAMHL